MGLHMRTEMLLRQPRKRMRNDDDTPHEHTTTFDIQFIPLTDVGAPDQTLHSMGGVTTAIFLAARRGHPPTASNLPTDIVHVKRKKPPRA